MIQSWSAVFGNFFGEQPLYENLPIFGVVLLFKKKVIALFFMILSTILRVQPLFLGTDFLNGNLKVITLIG